MRRVLFPMALFSAISFQFNLRPVPAGAQSGLPPDLQEVGIDQRLGDQVPRDLFFRDETGNPVRLGVYFDGKPVILALVYFQCPMLCTQVLNGLLSSLRALSFDVGDEFEVLAVSFDPGETPILAAAKKDEYIRSYGRVGGADGWHFLTGTPAAIDRLTSAVGFRYKYNPETQQFAHASGIIVLTPGGKIARYYLGIEYPPRDLRLGLVEASSGKIGSPVDQILLYCFQYDPATGRYSLAILNVVRIAGIATLLGLGTLIAVLLRREPPTPALPRNGAQENR